VVYLSGLEGASNMTTLIIGSLLLGAILGLRFSIRALVPATVIGLILIGFGGFGAVILGVKGLELSGGWVVAAMIIFTIALQIGYLLGVLGRALRANEEIVRPGVG
jgi:hypothetical protein